MAIVEAEKRELVRISPYRDEVGEQKVKELWLRTLPLIVIDAHPGVTENSVAEAHHLRMRWLDKVFSSLSGAIVGHHFEHVEYGSELGLHYDMPEYYGTGQNKVLARFNTVSTGTAHVLAGIVKPSFIQLVNAHSNEPMQNRSYSHRALQDVEDLLLHDGVVDDEICEPIWYEGDIQLGDTIGFWHSDQVRMNPSLHRIRTTGTQARRYISTDFDIPMVSVQQLVQAQSELVQ